MKTTDGGATWTTSVIPIPSYATPSPIAAIAVDSTLPSVVWAGHSRFNGVYKSTDGGGSWTYVWQLGGMSTTRMVFDGPTLYIGGTDVFSSNIAKTADRGATWSTLAIRGNRMSLFGLAANAGVVFAGTQAGGDAFAY